MSPKNKMFQSYVDKKLKSAKDHEAVISATQKTDLNITFDTHMKIGKLFEDLL